jgi:membrane fusion protein (multidrug efflux system)
MIARDGQKKTDKIARMRKVAQIAAAAAVVAVAGASYLYFGGTSPSGPGNGGEAPAVAVEVAKAVAGELRQNVEAVGNTRANEAVTITAKTSGIVHRIAFQGGENVEAGAILVELDTRESGARLAEARATRDNAQRAFDRANELWKSRNIPKAKVEELQSATAAADARVRIEEAKQADLIIRAPFAGQLGIRQVSLGALVEPGDRVVTLDDTHLIKLDLDVPEAATAGLRPGLRILATGVAAPDRRFEGSVKVIDSRIDPQTRSIKIEAELPNPDGALKPGMFLNATLEVSIDTNAVLIPEEAVQRSGQETFVFVVRDGRAQRTLVVLGPRLPGKVSVRSGVSAGDDVVISGLQFLRDGGVVRPTLVPTPEAQPGAEPKADPAELFTPAPGGGPPPSAPSAKTSHDQG